MTKTDMRSNLTSKLAYATNNTPKARTQQNTAEYDYIQNQRSKLVPTDVASGQFSLFTTSTTASRVPAILRRRNSSLTPPGVEVAVMPSDEAAAAPRELAMSVSRDAMPKLLGEATSACGWIGGMLPKLTTLRSTGAAASLPSAASLASSIKTRFVLSCPDAGSLLVLRDRIAGRTIPCSAAVWTTADAELEGWVMAVADAGTWVELDTTGDMAA